MASESVAAYGRLPQEAKNCATKALNLLQEKGESRSWSQVIAGSGLRGLWEDIQSRGLTLELKRRATPDEISSFSEVISPGWSPR
jgi:hypothetical protein